MRLNQVTVPSTDVSSSVEFYKLLGLIQIVGSTPDYARFVCPDGDSTFSVHRVESVAAGERSQLVLSHTSVDDRRMSAAAANPVGIAGL